MQQLQCEKWLLHFYITVGNGKVKILVAKYSAEV